MKKTYISFNSEDIESLITIAEKISNRLPWCEIALCDLEKSSKVKKINQARIDALKEQVRSHQLAIEKNLWSLYECVADIINNYKDEDKNND